MTKWASDGTGWLAKGLGLNSAWTKMTMTILINRDTTSSPQMAVWSPGWDIVTLVTPPTPCPRDRITDFSDSKLGEGQKVLTFSDVVHKNFPSTFAVIGLIQNHHFDVLLLTLFVESMLQKF